MWKTAAIGTLTVAVIALLVTGSLRAQMGQRDGDRPATLPAFPGNAQLPQLPQTTPEPPPPAQPGTQYPPRSQRQLPPVASPAQQSGVSTLNLIPSFLQAGRVYSFEPAVGEPFVAKVISIDATGWVQVQRHPGGNVGPVAEWYNLRNVVAMRAQ